MSVGRTAVGAGRGAPSSMPPVTHSERCEWKRAEIARALLRYIATRDAVLLAAVNARRDELHEMQVAHARLERRRYCPEPDYPDSPALDAWLDNYGCYPPERA